MCVFTINDEVRKDLAQSFVGSMRAMCFVIVSLTTSNVVGFLGNRHRRIIVQALQLLLVALQGILQHPKPGLHLLNLPLLNLPLTACELHAAHEML